MNNKNYIKFYFIFALISTFLFSSCENLLFSNKVSVNFSLSEKTSDEIIRTVSSNRNITDESLLRIEYKLTGDGNLIDSGNISVPLKNLKMANFIFQNVVFGDNYVISLAVYYNNVVIYKGSSDPFDFHSDFIANVILEKRNSIISYNGGGSKLPSGLKTEYFIDSNIILPKISQAEGGMEDKNKRFAGWYTNDKFTGNAITELGQNNFLGDVELYAKWEEVPNISNVKVLQNGSKGISISWQPPKNITEEYTVVINGGPGGEVRQKYTPGDMKPHSAEIKNVVKEKKYNFTLYVIDGEGNKSAETKTTSVTFYGLTEIPTVLQAGTDGTAGTSATYINFGDWPQSRLKDDSIISDKGKTISINGLDCYKGSDSNYYVKVNAKPYSNTNFNDKTVITGSKDYYFKLEPIKWRVLTEDYNGTGKKLIFAEDAIMAGAFGALEYKNSTARQYLNNDFLNGAFGKNAQENISITSVDNSSESTFGAGEQVQSNSHATENTDDKIFLLSTVEATSSEYGFKASNDNTKIKYITDYSLASGAQSDEALGAWWLRSPLHVNNAIRRIINKSGMLNFNKPDDTSHCLVPALVLN